jgi:transcriptional regulator with XRE-family HTH domain
MSTKQRLFWDDLARDLEDPEFLREYVVESVRIDTVDRIVNALDQAREAAGLTKADLARSISAEPASIRRLFTGVHGNPTLSTLSEVAAALGLRITLEPLPPAERKVVTKPLREGKPGNARDLAAYHIAKRSLRQRAAPA